MRLAVLSDIHGNVFALEAVLADLERQQADQVVNLGDVLSGPVDPQATAERLLPLRWLTIRGNHERQLLTMPPAEMGASDHLAHRCLTTEQRAWLASFPPTATLPGGVLLTHGTPGDDLSYLLETVEPGGARPATVTEVHERLGSVTASLVLCGHSHVPRTLQLPVGPLVVNPGSVGWPAFADDAPHLHVMEAGTPHARYALVEQIGGRWQARHVQVEYDWEQAARAAEANGRPEAAFALRTGPALA